MALTAIATDRLVVVQAVSSSKRTLIIQRGMAEGISVGQEAVFATKEVSFLARAIEVTPVFSQWKVATSRGIIPFEKGQVILMGGNPNTIWSAGTTADGTESSGSITPALSVNTALSREFSDRYFRSKRSWIFKGAYTHTISDSVSDTVSSNEISRNGMQGEVVYSFQMTPSYEFTLGTRIDFENQERKEPALSVPTTRILGTLNLNYHFYHHFQDKNHFYTGATFGLGQSTTTVGEVSSSGYCMILPSVTFGMETGRSSSKKYSFITEAVAESINSKESFPNGETQSTNIINAKISFGIKF